MEKVTRYWLNDNGTRVIEINGKINNYGKFTYQDIFGAKTVSVGYFFETAKDCAMDRVLDINEQLADLNHQKNELMEKYINE